MSETFYDASNLSISNGFGRNRDRYYLEEYFKRKPAINADIQNSAESTRMIANPDFELLGQNATTDDVIFSAATPGIVLETDGGGADQIIVAPHRDTDQSAWYNIQWKTQYQVEWECAIETTNSIADMAFWAGLKKSEVPETATDTEQAYFMYSSSATPPGSALANTTNLFFIYSVAGTKYITDLGIAVAADTIYKLRIVFDSDRKISVFVGSTNKSTGVITPMTQYGLTSTSGSTGTTESTVSSKSVAITDDVSLWPFVGIEDVSGAKKITLCYEKISRTLA